MTRPPAVIDWKKVDDLLVAGSSGSEIAAHLGLHPTTIYNHCVTDKGISFSEYTAEKHAKGDSLLRAHQFAKALGFTNKGDNALLIWLGKVRLKQSEVVISDKPPNENIIDQENDQMAEMHKLRMKIIELEAKLDNKPETGPELRGSDTPV